METDGLAARIAALQADMARQCATTAQFIALSDAMCNSARINREADLVVMDRSRQLLAESWALVASVNGLLS